MNIGYKINKTLVNKLHAIVITDTKNKVSTNLRQNVWNIMDVTWNLSTSSSNIIH